MDALASTPDTSTARILKSALELFSTRGYEATSVREICAAADITKPTLYHFFGSKEGVYRALVDGAFGRFGATLEQRVAAAGNTRTRLKGVARGFFEEVRDNRELVRFVLGLIHNPSSVAPPTDFQRFYERDLELVGRCLDDGVRSGELRPGPLETRLLLFMGGIGESICGSLIMGRPELTPALADSLVDVLLDGWTASAPIH